MKIWILVLVSLFAGCSNYGPGGAGSIFDAAEANEIQASSAGVFGVPPSGGLFVQRWHSGMMVYNDDFIAFAIPSNAGYFRAWRLRFEQIDEIKTENSRTIIFARDESSLRTVHIHEGDFDTILDELRARLSASQS